MSVLQITPEQRTNSLDQLTEEIDKDPAFQHVVHPVKKLKGGEDAAAASAKDDSSVLSRKVLQLSPCPEAAELAKGIADVAKWSVSGNGACVHEFGVHHRTYAPVFSTRGRVIPVINSLLACVGHFYDVGQTASTLIDGVNRTNVIVHEDNNVFLSQALVEDGLPASGPAGPLPMNTITANCMYGIAHALEGRQNVLTYVLRAIEKRHKIEQTRLGRSVTVGDAHGVSTTRMLQESLSYGLAKAIAGDVDSAREVFTYVNEFSQRWNSSKWVLSNPQYEGNYPDALTNATYVALAQFLSFAPGSGPVLEHFKSGRRFNYQTTKSGGKVLCGFCDESERHDDKQIDVPATCMLALAFMLEAGKK